MTTKPAKLGAVFYGLWGLIHMLGGGFLLSVAFTSGGDFLQGLFGTSHAVSTDFLSATVEIERMATTQVFAYHAFNLVWIGLVSFLIAVRMNWKTALLGFGLT
ncbi:MAG: hypothetical protein HC806_09755 [Anaerolineae bacterium]|nr:hypothetical protein [Anaerolineae bacterium]